MGFSLTAAALFAPMTVLAATANDPPVRVRLSDEVYVSGERARMSVRTDKDGYLVVMRIDTEGRVRVIFPVDPTKDAAVKGGKNIEIRSRGDRDAFTVSEKKGTGLVFAARSDKPFNFLAFMTGDHWNPEALAPASPETDPESALLSLADRMTDGHYDYDAVTYTVGDGMYGGHGRRPPYAVFDPWYPPLVGGYGYCCAPGYFGGWSPFYGPRFGTVIGFSVHSFRGRRR